MADFLVSNRLSGSMAGLFSVTPESRGLFRQHPSGSALQSCLCDVQDRPADRPIGMGPVDNAADDQCFLQPERQHDQFPAAVLQPPYFHPQADDALNYGGIGAIIGHEMTHAYDDQGSQFDAYGKLENWWTEADRKAFKARTDTLVKQF